MPGFILPFNEPRLVRTASLDVTGEVNKDASKLLRSASANVGGKRKKQKRKIKGGAIPKEFIPGVEKGIETVSDTGILAGFPIIDYKVTILDGLHHDVDSSVLAFELASRQCFKEACTRATLKLLEPVMRVEVVTPEDYMGDVIGDLNSRRGQISTQEQRGNATVITAMVPCLLYTSPSPRD